MGLYAKYIFPHILEYVMSGSILVDCRKDALSEVKGEILEIGFGTGMNLPYYPEHVHRITGVDVNIHIHSKAEKRLKSSPITVDYHTVSAELLPFPNQTFDAVVSTFTLCSINDIHRALSEIARVLKLNGRFFFAEHGLSPDYRVQKWQNRLNPINKALSCGCNLNRNIKELVESCDLKILKLDQFYLEKTPKIFGYMYKGIATINPS
ncbi:MAG TPA: class I SAM-dependent methyltransferase [Candidatus Wunengus sp. YC63]|uniref:class I SAM-dependent methyltransferase n=1 Tax=unclassified Candidatus Wunengus TaxID=3367695 RepID=UPI00402502DC